MPVLKGALHTHTTCSDGQLTPAELVTVYRELGFQFLAITDHDHLWRRPSGQPADRRQCVSGFPGRGIDRVRAGLRARWGRFGRSGGVADLQSPWRDDMPFEKILAVIAAVHAKLPLDCVEVSSKGFYTPQYDVPEIAFPKIVSDDAHTRAMCGRSWITVDCEFDKDTILRQILRRAINELRTRTAVDLADSIGLVCNTFFEFV